MSNTFFASDTHLGHKNILVFRHGGDQGARIRPHWDAIEEHDEALIENWNRVVRPQDKVYHLGDCVINRKFLPLLGRLNGNKRLVRGNHDIFPITEYLKYFGEVYGVRVLEDMILSHIPLNKECITARFQTNVHGHLHSNVIKDPMYLCVSMEQINFTPISIEDVRAQIRVNKERGFVVNPYGAQTGVDSCT